jgi:thiamine biosynthesis lipoprotein
MKNLRSRKRPGITDAGCLLLLALFSLLPGCGDTEHPTDPITFSGQTMGTLYTVKIVGRGAISAERLSELQDGIESILNEINCQMSAYDSLSEISAFNHSRDTAWFGISSDFAVVVDSSLEVCRLSEGALDITVAPLVNLWGFGPENVPQRMPSQAQLDSALNEIGYDKLEVRLSPPAIRKVNMNVSCDLAAVAKGYAVDRIASYLSGAGHTDYLVEIGGEIKATGRNAEGMGWHVGIKTPDTTSAIQQTVTLHNQAMATSGSYLNYFEKDGVRYSHLIDPRTGSPIEHHLVSVSVVHESCLFADAMATAISVAGPDDGYELAVRLKLAVFLIVREDDRYTELMTTEFEQLLTPTT